MPGLESILGTKSRITILRQLCDHADKDFSICELADAAGIDKSLVSRIVSDLEKEKIIRVNKRRNLKLCQINSQNGIYRLLSEVFASEKHLNGKAKKGRFSWSV